MKPNHTLAAGIALWSMAVLLLSFHPIPMTQLQAGLLMSYIIASSAMIILELVGSRPQGLNPYHTYGE